MPLKDQELNKVYHVINIPNKEQRFLTELVEDVMDRKKQIAAIQAVGRASAGFLGNPGNAVLILGAVLGIVGGIVGVQGAEVISRFFGTLQGLHEAQEGQDQRDAANDFIKAQKALIEFFAPFLKGALP